MLIILISLFSPLLQSLEKVVNKDTDKEAHVPPSVFIIAGC